MWCMHPASSGLATVTRLDTKCTMILSACRSTIVHANADWECCCSSKLQQLCTFKALARSQHVCSIMQERHTRIPWQALGVAAW